MGHIEQHVNKPSSQQEYMCPARTTPSLKMIILNYGQLKNITLMKMHYLVKFEIMCSYIFLDIPSTIL